MTVCHRVDMATYSRLSQTNPIFRCPSATWTGTQTMQEFSEMLLFYKVGKQPLHTGWCHWLHVIKHPFAFTNTLPY